jgi:hypothetical protein
LGGQLDDSGVPEILAEAGANGSAPQELPCVPSPSDATLPLQPAPL